MGNHTREPKAEEAIGISSSLDILARDMKELVKKIQNLSHLGIEDNQIALPKICVVGDQSTGKSSLIEGISEIKVPRSAGTCTRCPMEINLCETEPDQNWACSIYLSNKYTHDPQKKSRKLSKLPDCLGPWVSYGGRDEFPFITLTDKELVQNAIYWAQLAILNPSANHNDYIPGKNAETSTDIEVLFSPNIVRLDISGPHFPTLSFYDLPGVISQAEHDKDAYLVHLVEKMVRQHISQANCIILLTLTMTDDATNSSAARIIRSIKAAKDRTLGVLTKPDRLPLDLDHTQWVEMLNGSKFQLGHGYFVVKNNPDTNVDHAEARKDEETFFDSPFWSQELGEFQDRFGVQNLQSALSSILLTQIQNCLPSVIKQIDDKANRIDIELRTLPAPPADNLQCILLEKVITLRLRLNTLFNGGLRSNQLQREWSNINTDFKKALEITRPRLLTLAQSDEHTLAEKYDSDCEVVSGPAPRRLKRKARDMESKPVEGSGIKTGFEKGEMYITGNFHAWKSSAEKFSLEDVRLIKQESSHAGIPNQIDPSAIRQLNSKSIKHWIKLLEAYTFAVHGVVLKALMTTLDDVIATQYRQTGLYRELQKVFSTFSQDMRADSVRHAVNYFNVEYDRPFTLAQNQHKTQKVLILGELESARHLTRAKCFLRHRQYLEDNVSKVEQADLGPDDYTEELEMMASSRAYYNIASSRFLDVICLLVESKIRSKCQNDLVITMNNELRADSQDRCVELMAEDPERQSRRLQLMKERAKLTQAQTWITSVHPNENSETGEEQTIGEEQEWTEYFA
ncbi:hypothetical protein N7495_004257 [Penicillium taxi]|uniref:uncharacterized protein n=1 Tax=Penicillium taxi TaxID=168475 RepID=UPI00254545FC|nr:uncharacterized protein N7495_004257 [Penicillium taxi]KAJ5899513.1 hypothetical protein N7495_004257 [Penicillium taxi]